MSFVAAGTTLAGWATATGAAVGLTGTAALVGGGAILGAGVGGAYSALTGDGKILDSMLTGAGLGGLGGLGLGAAGFGATAAGAGGIGATGATGVGAGTTAAEVAAASNTPALAAASNINPATGLSWEATGSGLSAGAGSTPTDPSWWSTLSGTEKLGVGLGATSLLSMLGGQPEGVAPQGDKGMIRPYEYTTAMRQPQPGQSQYFEPIEYDQYGRTTKPLDTSERNYFDQKFTALPTYAAANGGQVPNLNNMPAGGLASIQSIRDGYGAPQTMDGNIPQFALGGLMSRAVGLANAKSDNVAPKYSFDPQTRKYIELNQEQANAEDDLSRLSPFNAGMFGKIIRQVVGLSKQAQQPDNKVRYDASTQRYENFAAGGHLGGYSDGGQLLRGPGDGVSDDIPASINNKQPARLADGEFVIPARIVSELGNGSTDAGAKRLYSMMDRIQADRSKTTGKGKVAVDSKARKHLPA